MTSLADALPDEIERVQELIREYDALPNNAGAFGATVMRDTVRRATRILAGGDALEILRVFEELKRHTG